MQLATRPWITAGVALAGAGVIAVTPLAPALPEVTVPAVQLTAGALTTGEDIWQAVIAAAFGPDAALLDATSHDGFFSSLPNILPGLADHQLLYDFSASPASGVLLGDVGTVLSPMLALQNSIHEIIGDLGGASPDPAAALTEFLDIPAAVTNAFLYGYGEIDLAPLVSALGPIAQYYTLDAELPLGGLLSPAGSFFTALALEESYQPPCSEGPPIICIRLEELTPGNHVGPIASLEELSHAVAQAIGSSGTGNSTAEALNLTAQLGELPTVLTALTTELSTLPAQLSALPADILASLF